MSTYLSFLCLSLFVSLSLCFFLHTRRDSNTISHGYNSISPESLQYNLVNSTWRRDHFIAMLFFYDQHSLYEIWISWKEGKKSFKTGYLFFTDRQIKPKCNCCKPLHACSTGLLWNTLSCSPRVGNRTFPFPPFTPLHSTPEVPGQGVRLYWYNRHIPPAGEPLLTSWSDGEHLSWV